MDRLIPFCEECGDPRVMVSGEHPGETGIVRWAMYACGHTRTQIEFDGVPADDELDLLPAVLPRRV